MQIFKDSIPNRFTGVCYREDREKICYYLEGLLHREDGPAVVYDNGTQEWWVKGSRHRLDGPAIYYSENIVKKYGHISSRMYWINGSNYSESSFYNHSKVIHTMIRKKLERIVDEEIT